MEYPGAILHSTRIIDLYIVPQTDIHRFCAAEIGFVKKGYLYHGCARFKRNNTRCEIFIAEPLEIKPESFGTLGHETWHCFEGDFHY